MSEEKKPKGAEIYINGSHHKIGVHGKLFRFNGVDWTAVINDFDNPYLDQGTLSVKQVTQLIEDVLDLNKGFYSELNIVFSFMDNVFICRDIEDYNLRSKRKNKLPHTNRSLEEAAKMAMKFNKTMNAV